jgi:hypothetical protein
VISLITQFFALCIWHARVGKLREKAHRAAMRKSSPFRSLLLTYLVPRG